MNLLRLKEKRMKYLNLVMIGLVFFSCDNKVDVDVSKINKNLVDGLIDENLDKSKVFVKISNFDLDRICKGIIFDQSDGSQSEGKKDCETETPKDCSEGGEKKCVSNTDFPAVDKSVLRPENIKNEITIGGVLGKYPSALYPLDGNTSTLDLTQSNFNSSLSSNNAFEFFDSLGQRYSLAGDTDLIASNIRSGIGLFGITGTYTGGYSFCTSDAQIGCITDTTYKAAIFTNFTAGNIKKGVTLGGVTGDYPSSTYPIQGASSDADLNSTNFNTSITSSSVFEYWDSTGQRYTGVGDEDLASANIITGKNIFGVSGSNLGQPCSYSTEASCDGDNTCSWNGASCSVNPWLFKTVYTFNGVTGKVKTNCRNLINSSVYNTDNMPPDATGDTTGSNLDWWDTGNLLYDVNYADTKPTIWSNDNVCGDENWLDLTADGACDSSSDDCMMKDKITGLSWSESGPSSSSSPGDSYLDWSSAVEVCYNLSFGGNTDWRLPTAFELQHALANGFGAIAYHDGFSERPLGNTLIKNDSFILDKYATFWTATTWLTNSEEAAMISIASGSQTFEFKDDITKGKVICVR